MSPEHVMTVETSLENEEERVVANDSTDSVVLRRPAAGSFRRTTRATVLPNGNAQDNTEQHERP